MLETYLKIIQEGYILSDKTISVNLIDFENNIKNKLLIVGVLGAGKTSLLEHLKKKYQVSEIFSDDYGLEKALKSSNRMIIETIEIASLYMKKPEYRKIILNYPMIIIGMSSIKAGLRATKRDGTTLRKSKNKKDAYRSLRDNLFYFQKVLNNLRQDVIKLPNADIREYKIPKFKPVYY